MRSHRIVVSVVALLAAWQGLSMWNPSMFPPPLEVFGLTYELTVEGDVRGTSALEHLLLTLARVFLATAVALSLAVSIAILMWTDGTIEQVVSFWLPIWMTPPDVIVILVTMILVGFNTAAVVASVALVYTPFALVTIWGGMQDIDGDLVEMANAFGTSRRLTWRHVYLPYLTSYVFSALRTVFGMTWKVAVIAEVLGISRGVGAQIRFWYTQGEIPQILAYTTLFIGVVFIIEYGILRPIQNRAFVWRREAPT